MPPRAFCVRRASMLSRPTMARKAMALAEAGSDLLVLDINLPDIDGFEVCRQLRCAQPHGLSADRAPVGDVHGHSDMEPGPGGRRRQLSDASGRSGGADRHRARTAVCAPGRHHQACRRRPFSHRVRTGIQRHRAARCDSSSVATSIPLSARLPARSRGGHRRIVRCRA